MSDTASNGNGHPVVSVIVPETTYPESRVLIIGTGGTICMQQGPDGLQPTDNFLENAMAPRPSFNDRSEPSESVPALTLSIALGSHDIYMNGSHEHGVPAHHDWDHLSLTSTCHDLDDSPTNILQSHSQLFATAKRFRLTVSALLQLPMIVMSAMESSSSTPSWTRAPSRLMTGTPWLHASKKTTTSLMASLSCTALIHWPTQPLPSPS